jgi:hypothetical protein
VPDAINEAGVDEDTLVILSSDNGIGRAVAGQGGSSGPWRGDFFTPPFEGQRANGRDGALARLAILEAVSLPALATECEAPNRQAKLTLGALEMPCELPPKPPKPGGRRGAYRPDSVAALAMASSAVAMARIVGATALPSPCRFASQPGSL